MNGQQRENLAREVASILTAKGFDPSRVVACILNRPDPTAEMGLGVELISVERAAQLLREGFSPRHDDAMVGGELAAAAMCYASAAADQACGVEVGMDVVPMDWPWPAQSWKPSCDPVKNLTRAGALIAAEIDRLTRVRASTALEQATS